MAWEKRWDPRSHLALCAHVFEEQECSSRFEYAPDLAQITLRIMHGTQDECDHRALEMRIGEWEGFDWGAP